MIDIIALYLLMKRIRRIVESKGYPSLKWRIAVVAFWFLGLFTGILVSMLIARSNSIEILALSAYLCAAGFSLAVQKRAEALPDNNQKNDDWIDNLGNN